MEKARRFIERKRREAEDRRRKWEVQRGGQRVPAQAAKAKQSGRAPEPEVANRRPLAWTVETGDVHATARAARQAFRGTARGNTLVAPSLRPEVRGGPSAGPDPSVPAQHVEYPAPRQTRHGDESSPQGQVRRAEQGCDPQRHCPSLLGYAPSLRLPLPSGPVNQAARDYLRYIMDVEHQHRERFLILVRGAESGRQDYRGRKLHSKRV